MDVGIWKASMKFGNWRKILGRIVALAESAGSTVSWLPPASGV
jgi:hypothetical protein